MSNGTPKYASTKRVDGMNVEVKRLKEEMKRVRTLQPMHVSLLYKMRLVLLVNSVATFVLICVALWGN